MNDENTFTTTELEALSAAFGDWTWNANSIEPDARVDVLFDPRNGDIDHDLPFLVRDDDQWRWTDGPGRTQSEPRTWAGVQNFLRSQGAHLRIPNATELSAGGWEIVAGPPRDEDDDQVPLSTATLLSARDLLEREDGEPPSKDDTAEATALALTSIAATLHDLSVLLEEEIAWRRSQRPVEQDDVEETEDEDSAHRSLGPGEDPGFSFSGR